MAFGVASGTYQNYEWNRSQLKRRDKMEPTLPQEKSISLSRRPIQKTLSEQEILEVKERYAQQRQKTVKWNLFWLLFISATGLVAFIWVIQNIF